MVTLKRILKGDQHVRFSKFFLLKPDEKKGFVYERDGDAIEAKTEGF